MRKYTYAYRFEAILSDEGQAIDVVEDCIEIFDADPWTEDRVHMVVEAIYNGYPGTWKVQKVRRVQWTDIDPMDAPIRLTFVF